MQKVSLPFDRNDGALLNQSAMRPSQFQFYEERKQAIKVRTPNRKNNARCLKRVLIVYKKTYFMELSEKQDQRMLDLLAQRHPSVSKVIESHEEHLSTLGAVQRLLGDYGIDFKAVTREFMAAALASEVWDMVATIGGDGTVLDASHFVAANVPVLGINSSVSTSHGHFCLAQFSNLAEVFEQIFSGRRKPLQLMRLQLGVDGKALSELVLNEVLVAHRELGETSRYVLKLNGKDYTHKSDGLLIGTASGSTGWMRSYGCKILSPRSRRFHFVTRGLIIQDGGKRACERGMLDRGDKISVMSMMPDGVLLLDGRHIKYPFPRGSVLTVQPALADFKLFIDADANEKYRNMP